MLIKSFKIISLIIVCLFAGTTGFIFAEENNEIISAEKNLTTTELKNLILDEDVTSDDLGISDPKILPDSPFYFLKNISRNIQSIFTFNPVKKAELKLKFTNERLMEIKKLSEVNPEKTEILNKALENYKLEMVRTEQAVEKIKKTIDDEKVNKFIDKFIDHNLKHQKLFVKFENQLQKQLPLENYEKLKEIKQENLEKISNISLKLISPEMLGEKLTDIMEKQKGDDFKHLKNLDILEGLKNKVPEQAKEAIRNAQENSLKRLNTNVNLENMPEPKKQKMQNHIKNIIKEKIQNNNSNMNK